MLPKRRQEGRIKGGGSHSRKAQDHLRKKNRSNLWLLKWIIHPKIKTSHRLLTFFPNPYELLSSTEHKIRYFEECLNSTWNVNSPCLFLKWVVLILFLGFNVYLFISIRASQLFIKMSWTDLPAKQHSSLWSRMPDFFKHLVHWNGTPTCLHSSAIVFDCNIQSINQQPIYIFFIWQSVILKCTSQFGKGSYATCFVTLSLLWNPKKFVKGSTKWIHIIPLKCHAIWSQSSDDWFIFF